MPDEGQRHILIDAADEAFAGMRAYHASELTHKQQTVTILTTILAGNGALIAAGFGALDHIGVIGWEVICLAALGVFVATFVCASLILDATIQKMNADAVRYDDYKQISIRARTLLGLYEPMKVGDREETVYPEVKSGQGSAKSKRVLWTFYWMVIIFTLAGWLAVCAAWYAAGTA